MLDRSDYFHCFDVSIQPKGFLSYLYTQQQLVLQAVAPTDLQRQHIWLTEKQKAQTEQY